MKLFGKRDNEWIEVENFDAGHRTFGLRVIGSRHSVESCPSAPGFDEFLIDWLSRYQTELSVEIHLKFLYSIKACLLNIPKNSELTTRIIPAYRSIEEADSDIRGNFALGLCSIATQDNFNDLVDLVNEDYYNNDSDVFIPRYFAEFRWNGAEKGIVDSLVMNALRFGKYRHETSMVAAKKGLLEAIPLIEAARSELNAGDQLKDEKYAKALYSLYRQKYVADLTQVSNLQTRVARAATDLAHEENAPFAAYFLGKERIASAEAALEAAATSKVTALRREAKAALKKLRS